jgi:hypothetical protein
MVHLVGDRGRALAPALTFGFVLLDVQDEAVLVTSLTVPVWM